MGFKCQSFNVQSCLPFRFLIFLINSLSLKIAKLQAMVIVEGEVKAGLVSVSFLPYFEEVYWFSAFSFAGSYGGQAGGQEGFVEQVKFQFVIFEKFNRQECPLPFQ